MGMTWVLVVAAAVPLACAGGKSTPKGKDGGSGSGSGGGSADARGSGSAAPGAPIGILDARVEWKDAPSAVRVSPGRDPCRGPRRGRAKIHTLWGVANAVVIVDGAGPSAAAGPAGPVQLALRDCALGPPVAVAAAAPATLHLYNGDQRRHVATIAPAVAIAKLADAPVRMGDASRRGVLPWAGSELAVAAAEPGAIAVATDATPDDLAWFVVAPPGSRIGVTDDTGAAMFPNLPAGTHGVTAWLPPAAGEPGIVVTGTVTIEADRVVRFTLDVGARTATAGASVPAVTAGSGAAPGSGSDAGDGDDDDP
jgi:hypothetical protein